MKVYRYLSEKELNNILSENMSEIGSKYPKKKYIKINSHHYRENVRYLHFFKHRQDMIKVILANFLPKCKYYFCEFDIPAIILLMGAGKGHYEGSGYKNDTDTVREYIVPNTLMKKTYLKSYILDEQTAEWDNFLETNSQLQFFSNKFDDDIMEK